MHTALALALALLTACTADAGDVHARSGLDAPGYACDGWPVEVGAWYTCTATTAAGETTWSGPLDVALDDGDCRMIVWPVVAPASAGQVDDDGRMTWTTDLVVQVCARD